MQRIRKDSETTSNAGASVISRVRRDNAPPSEVGSVSGQRAQPAVREVGLLAFRKCQRSFQSFAENENLPSSSIHQPGERAWLDLEREQELAVSCG